MLENKKNKKKNSSTFYEEQTKIKMYNCIVNLGGCEGGRGGLISPQTERGCEVSGVASNYLMGNLWRQMSQHGGSKLTPWERSCKVISA